MDALRTEIPPVRINLKTFGKWFRSLAKIQNGFSVYFTGQQTQVPLSRQKKVAIKLYCQNVFSFWCDYKRWCGRHEELCEFMINGFRNELFNIRPLIINQTRRRDTWKQIGDMPEYTSDFHLDAQSWNAFFKKVQPVLSFDPEYFKENRINAFVDEAFADNWWERRYAYILSIEMLVRLRVFLFRELYHDAVRAYMFTTGNVQISEETALRQLIRAYLESMSNGKQLDLFHSVSYIGAKPVISKRTADNYTMAVLSILNARLEEISGQGIDLGPIQEGPKDQRIKLGISPSIIEMEFRRLCCSESSRANKPYLTEEDVDLFLRRSFQGFAFTKNAELITTEFHKGVVRYFLYSFKQKYAEKSPNEPWVRLLMNNFTAYHKLDFDSFRKKFATQPTKYPDHLDLRNPAT
jgi:hypothetical protein